MVKRRREADSDGANTASADDRTVFIDTSLDTHLAMLVSKSDTVSDFKRKIVLEHMHCFPDIGEIHIDSLKVKRRTNFYHLPDLMLVWSAFQGANTNWFLSADASGTPAHQLNQNSLQLGTSAGLKMGVNNIDDNTCRGLSSVVNMLQTLPMPLPDGVSEKNLASDMIPVCEADKSLEKTAEMQSNDYSEENCMGIESRAKKKRKINHTEDACPNPSLRDASLPETVGSGISTVDAVNEANGCIILYQEQGKLNTSSATDEVSGERNDQCDTENGVGLEGKSALLETVGSGNSTVDEVKEATGDIILYQQKGKPDTSDATDEVSGSRNDQCDVEKGVVLEGKSAPDKAEESHLGSFVNSQTILDSDIRKEDTLLDSTVPEDVTIELSQDVTIEHSGGVSVRVPDSSDAMRDVSSDGSKKKKKKKGQKTAKKIQDNTDVEQSTKGDSMKPCTETREVDKKEEEKGLSLNCDPEIVMSLKSKASDYADPDLMPKEASFSSHVCHANAIVDLDSSVAMGDVSSEGKKKKKKKSRKTAKQIQDTTDMEQIAKDDSTKPCTETHKADKKEEEKGLSLNSDPEMVMPLSSKASDYADPDLMPKEASILSHVCHSNGIVEPDSSCAMRDVSSDGSKMRKKKAQKMAKQIQDTTDMEQTTKDDSIKPCPETHKADKKEEEKVLSLNCDPEIVTPLNSKASDYADPDLMPKEASFSSHVCHATAIVEPDSSCAMRDASSDGCKKKKKRAQKMAKQIQDTTDMEQTTKDGSIKPCTETHKADKNEETGLSLNCDPEIVMPLNSKASDYGPDLVPEEAMSSPRVCHVNAIVEPDSGGAMGDLYSDGSKRMKKKAQKAAKKFQDTMDMEQTIEDDSTKACTETRKVEKEEEEKGLSLNLDHETIMPSNSKASDNADQDLMPESSFSTHFGDANAIVQPEISSGGTKKKTKRRGKKSAITDIEKAGIEQTDNDGIGSLELLCPPTDPTPEETHKEESISYHKEMDVNMALLDSSTQDASEEFRGADRNEAEFLILTQSKQAMGDVDTENKKAEEKTQLSAVGKDNSIVEFTEVEKDIKNSVGKTEKAKRKKKRKHTGSDVQENLPSKDQKVGVEALTTDENLNRFVSSEQKGGHEASLQALSNKSEEKLEEIHTAPAIKVKGGHESSLQVLSNKSEEKLEEIHTAPAIKVKGGHESSLQVLSNKSEEKLEEIQTAPVITDDPAKTSANGGVGVNFKQYFVPGPNEDKTDSGNKTAAMPNEEMRTSKNMGENGLPSVDVSTDLQNSVKTIKNKGREKKTRVTKDSGSRQGDSEQNLARDEVISNSSKRAKNRVKEKNPSLDKSSSKKTETLPEKKENKRLHSGLSVINKMVMKTPKKKCLLTKPGAIFQDNSGESSGDDNEIVHLKANVGSPSDSSSESSDSVGKGDLRQDSTRNGSNVAEGRSTGQKSISKLDFSASKDMTMDMILRSSKRFKKAKLNAHDNGYDSERQL